MERAIRVQVQRQFELVLPPELEVGARQRIVVQFRVAKVGGIGNKFFR
jgi:hypothetical protein